MNNLSFWKFYGYDIEITVGDLLLTTRRKAGDYGLCDAITITATESTSRTAVFSFIPPEEELDIDEFQSLPVKILIRTVAGFGQVFSGFVSLPTLDFLNRKIILECNDERANQIEQLNYSVIASVGVYDKVIFGETTDQNDELAKRLSTTFSSFDFDNYGNPVLTPWKPKDVADFVYTSADIQQGSNPTIKYTSRKKTTNSININFKYSYQRLHQQCINVTWPGYGDFIRDWYNQGRPSFPTRDQVNSAATGSNWKLVNPNLENNFVPLWPAGAYQGIIWQPNQVTNTYVGRTKLDGYLKDSTGNFVTVGDPARLVPNIVPVTDVQGKQIMDVATTVVTDTSAALCRGANFSEALRFSQNITEEYNVTVYAPQSVDKYGLVDTSVSYNITDDYDTSSWESGNQITNTNVNFYVDQKLGSTNVYKILGVAYLKAKHDILELHRDVTVGFRCSGLRPELDLSHTIEVTIEDPLSVTAYIHAKGKVSSIIHSFDFTAETAFTDVVLTLSRSDGVIQDSDPRVSIPVQDPGYIGVPQNIVLETHLGLDLNTTPGAAKWTGWIGNKSNPATATAGISRTAFTEAFVIEFPEIPDSLRNALTYSSQTNLVIGIPQDIIEEST